MKVHTFTSGPFQTNTYLVEDEGSAEAILIDPTIDAELLDDYITDNLLLVSEIINTHGHIDHTYGDAFFKSKTGATLAIHSADAGRLSATRDAATFGLKPPPPATADRLLQHGDVVAVGGLRFTVIHTPGHTPGGICLYGHKALFAGDTLFAGGIGRTDLPGGDYDTLIDSITRLLLVLPGDTVVYSGHGKPTTIAREKRDNPFLVGH
jgi:hydroxyacylglutathione hydrolase